MRNLNIELSSGYKKPSGRGARWVFGLAVLAGLGTGGGYLALRHDDQGHTPDKATPAKARNDQSVACAPGMVCYTVQTHAVTIGNAPKP